MQTTIYSFGTNTPSYILANQYSTGNISNVRYSNMPIEESAGTYTIGVWKIKYKTHA